MTEKIPLSDFRFMKMQAMEPHTRAYRVYYLGNLIGHAQVKEDRSWTCRAEGSDVTVNYMSKLRCARGLLYARHELRAYRNP